MSAKTLLYVANVDWYFKLHWTNRALAAIDNGYQVKLIAAFVTDGIKAEFELLGIECFDAPISRSGINPLVELRCFKKIYQTIKFINPNVIHTLTVKPNLYAGICGKFLKKPTVKSITGTGAVFSSDLLFFRLLKPLLIQLYRYVERGSDGAFVFENKEDQQIFFNSQIIKNQASIHIPGAGVDPIKYKYKNNLFTGDKVKILFASRLLKDKGLDTLITAMDCLYRERQDFELYIAGIFDSFSRNSYTESDIVELSEREYIYWLGQRNDINKLLTTVDIVALPTRYGEGIPRILIEAAFTGRVVITSNVPGCRELIQNEVTGYLIEPNDSQKLMIILDDILNSHDKSCVCAKKLYHSVRIDYSDDIVIKRFLEIYDSYMLN